MEIITEKSAVPTLRRMLTAGKVAVVGASNDPSKFGYMLFESIVKGGYSGRLYPVNAKAKDVQGVEAFQSISDIPGEIDLVIILIPAKFVPAVLNEAAEKGAAGAIICSGGFKETGNNDLETEIITVGANKNLRFIGPNVAGINYLPNRLCTMFFPVITTKGPLSIISQSGTVTNCLSEWAEADGFGITAALNLGNQSDLNESDFLEFLAEDKNTRSIMLYIEGISNGRRFLKALKHACQSKGVVVLKSGNTKAGRRSTATHSGSMASDLKVFSSACRQAGAVVVPDLESLYDGGKALASIKPPKGNRVFSISSSGGAGTLAADVTDRSGLVMPPPSDLLKKQFKEIGLSHLANMGNPLDNGADLDAEIFFKAAKAVDRCEGADIILLNLGDPIKDAADMIKKLAGQIQASLAVCYFAGGNEQRIGTEQMGRAGFAVFPTPERAMQAISVSVRSAAYNRRLSNNTHSIRDKQL